MKTKLLRKIRKQYSIVYYQYGIDAIWSNPYNYKYCVPNFWIGTFRKTKEDCIEYILDKLRDRYKKYSRKYKKPNYKGIKVWYNGN